MPYGIRSRSFACRLRRIKKSIARAFKTLRSFREEYFRDSFGINIGLCNGHSGVHDISVTPGSILTVLVAWASPWRRRASRFSGSATRERRERNKRRKSFDRESYRNVNAAHLRLFTVGQTRKYV